MRNSTVEVDDLTKSGAIQDEPSYQIPPEGFSTSMNMRDFGGGVQLVGGMTQVFGSGALSDAPTFTLYVSGPTQPWWLWASNTKIFVWDGTTNTDITRTSGGAYTATSPKQWNGTVFGGIPIMNNGQDIPQFWNSYSNATKMAGLTNWPSGFTCRVIRSFLSYLVGLNITSGGSNKPHLILWSTEASPGNLPATWNVADPTQDAGEEDLSDTISGQIFDGGELNGQFMIYKENSIWRMSFVGGTFIWDFKSFLETSGILATRCFALTGDGRHHVVLTQDDIIQHNGLLVESILDRRYRSYLFNQIDSVHYDESFVWSNPLFNEIWFCYPLAGSPVVNHALVWNYKYNTLREMDNTIVNFQSAAIGNVPSSAGVIWSAQTLNWNQDNSPWSATDRHRVVVTNNVSKKILKNESSFLNDGALYTGLLERVALAIIGRKRSGEWIEDFETKKLLQKLWPKVQNGPISIQVGYQDLVNGPISWGAIQAFDPMSQMWVDGVLGAGRAVAVRFYSNKNWRLDGYKLDMALLGKY